MLVANNCNRDSETLAFGLIDPLGVLVSLFQKIHWSKGSFTSYVMPSRQVGNQKNKAIAYFNKIGDQ